MLLYRQTSVDSRRRLRQCNDDAKDVACAAAISANASQYHVQYMPARVSKMIGNYFAIMSYPLPLTDQKQPATITATIHRQSDELYISFVATFAMERMRAYMFDATSADISFISRLPPASRADGDFPDDLIF